MSHPLDGVAARLDRAEENIRNLEAEIAHFREQNPHGTRTHFNPQTGNLTHRVFQNAPPPRLSVLVGEILFLLRSSLDQLIGRVLISITDPKDVDRVPERSGFPIFTSSVSWQSFDWTKIPGIAPEVRTAITECQPCNRTDGLPPEDDPLAVLASLHNIDKHRLLTVLVNRVNVSGVSFRPRGNVYVKDMHFLPNEVVTTGSSGVEADIVRGSITLGPGGGVEVNSNPTVEIAFKQVGTRRAEPVVPTLQSLHRKVKVITDEFRAFFL